MSLSSMDWALDSNTIFLTHRTPFYGLVMSFWKLQVSSYWRNPARQVSRCLFYTVLDVGVVPKMPEVIMYDAITCLISFTIISILLLAAFCYLGLLVNAVKLLRLLDS